MPAFDSQTLEQLDASIEVDMITPRSDGSASRRPVWVVVVDGEAYVRSYLGERGAWYRRALADGGVALGLGGGTLELAVEPEHGERLNGRISAAFRAKYAESSPESTEAMVTPEVVATTLRLVPPPA